MTAGPYSIGSDRWPGMSKVIEETGELGQVLGKLIATGGDPEHWDGSDLRERLVDECGDVLAAVSFFAETNGILDAVELRARRKIETFHQWHREQGTT